MHSYKCKHIYSQKYYEVAILAYFEQIGLEKYRGGPPHSSYNRENTAAMTQEINNTVLKKVDIDPMNA